MGDSGRLNLTFRVQGDSMWPALPEGTLVVIDDRRVRVAHARPGDIVVARHPFRRNTLVLKRIARASTDTVFLRGDAEHGSEDSRSFGPVRRDDVLGVVVETRRGTED